MTRYEHTQVGYMMIWIMGGAAVLVAMGASFSPFPRREFLLVPIAILAVTGVAFYKMTIKIDSETLRACFGLGIVCKKVSLADIAACEPIRIRWWYGWGIHLTPYGWLYNVAGWEAVAITLRNGRRFSLGTDDPHGLCTAIRGLAHLE